MATPAKYDFKPFAYGFQKDSPFLPMFNYYINEMKEKGSLEQIQAKYEPPKQICPDYRWKNFKGKHFQNFHLSTILQLQIGNVRLTFLSNFTYQRLWKYKTFMI